MPNELPYIAFDIPLSVDPDQWARALLAQVERDIAQGRRNPSDRARIFISSQSVNGEGEPPQVIAEKSAYDAAVKFDMRHFEAYALYKRDIPIDAVEVTHVDGRLGRVFCFPDGLWRAIAASDARTVVFTNEVNGESRRSEVNEPRFTATWLDMVYASEVWQEFERATSARASLAAEPTRK